MTVERYSVIETALCIDGKVLDGEVSMVLAPDQPELAALREELAAHLKIRDRELEIAAEHADVLQQRLADAERRNADISAELEVEKTNAAHWKATIAGEGQISKEARRYRGIRDILPLSDVIEITAECQTSVEWDLAIDAALNPNPEAASHDE